MMIENLIIKNFKMYREESFHFNSNFTVIVGNNGTGKTTVLEALCVALGGYLAPFDGVKGKNIYAEDIRREWLKLGDATVTKEYQVPVTVECTGNFGGRTIAWKRTRDRVHNGRTTRIYARDMTSYSEGLQKEIRSSNREVILPVMSYQSAGRLFSQKKDRWYDPFTKEEPSRLLGYKDCLDTESDVKLFGSWFKKMTMIQLQRNKQIGELQSVVGAVNLFMQRLSHGDSDTDIYFDFEENEVMIESGHGKAIPLRKMSAGFRSVIGMVADIAYRMSLLNPQLKDQTTRETPGVVLIDELDLHLHPKWQWRVVHALKDTFPRVQFIASTHAPIVIASCEEGDIIRLSLTDDPNDVDHSREKAPYGWLVEDILIELMDTFARDPRVARNIDIVERLYAKSLRSELSLDEKTRLSETVKGLYRILPEGDPAITNARIHAMASEVAGEEND